MGKLFGEFRVGQTFVTPRRTITEADVVAYAGLTGDYNPVHTDDVFAKASAFGARIAHGPMGIGIAFGLAARLDLIDGTVVALLGVTWDFRAPMRIGSTIHARIDVVETRDVRQADLGLLGLAIRIIDEHDAGLQDGSARLLMRRTHVEQARWGPVTS